MPKMIDVSEASSLDLRIRCLGLRRRRRGLTLIDILVVVALMALISSLVFIKNSCWLGDAQVDYARIQLADLSKALDQYKVKFEGYPDSLRELVRPPDGQKPFIERVPQDPWNHDYVYVFRDPGNSGRFSLRSRGPDGVLDTEDDVKRADR